MKPLKSAPWWALLIALLLLAHLGWMIWNWHNNRNLGSDARQFRFEHFHTNDATGIGIMEAKTDKPIWIEWDFGHTGKPDVLSYFFHGTNVFNLHLREGQRPRYDVIFYGPGKSQVWWWDNGSGSFTERISYDVNGNRSGFDVWYEGAWHQVDRRNKQNGLVINGQWSHLELTTDGMWTTEAESTNRF